MVDLDCKICFNMMDNEAHLPRILLCGHTFCTICIANILESTKSCPSCRKQTSCDKVDDYPVIYMILDIINNTKDSLESEKLRAKKKKEKHLEKFQILKKKFDAIKPMIESLHDKYELATKSVEQLNTLLESEDDVFDEEKSKDEINELDDILEGISSCKISSDSTVISDVSLHCKDFENVSLLLDEIRTGMMNNKKFAALLRIDGVLNFARLTFSDDYLCIHSFEVLDQTQDFIKIDFQDLLKTLMKRYSICAFLELYYRRGNFPRKAMVQVSDSASFLGAQFLKICTGETGVSYKGREYCQELDYNNRCQNGCIINLKNFGWNLNDDLDIYSKYLLCKGNQNITVDLNTYHLTCEKDGSFIIRDSSHSRIFTNAIGPIVDFSGDFRFKFRNATLRQISDCGIAFKVDLSFPCFILNLS